MIFSPWVIEVSCLALENNIKSVMVSKPIPCLISAHWILAYFPIQYYKILLCFCDKQTYFWLQVLEGTIIIPISLEMAQLHFNFIASIWKYSWATERKERTNKTQFCSFILNWVFPLKSCLGLLVYFKEL